MDPRPRHRVIGTVATLALLLQGCASPGTSVTQTLRVETPGCALAVCELRNDRGRWQLTSTPGSVTLSTSEGALQISCSAAGGVMNSTGAQASARPLTATGGVVGGVAGGAAAGATFGAAGLAFIPVLGAVILVASVSAGYLTGVAVESHTRGLTYPEVISVPMQCPSADGDGPKPQAAAPLGLQVRGLSPAQARDAGLAARGAVLVTEALVAGRAAAAGVRSGDILMAVGGEDVNDAAALEERLASWPAGRPLPLRVWRDGRAWDLVLHTVPAAR